MGKHTFADVLSGAVVEHFGSLRKAAAKMNISHTHLCNIVNGKKRMSHQIIKDIEHRKVFPSKTMEKLKEAWWHQSK